MKKNASVIQHRHNYTSNNSRSTDKHISVGSTSQIIFKTSFNEKRNYSSIGQSNIRAKKENKLKTNFKVVEINPKVLLTNKSSSAIHTKGSSLIVNELDKKDNSETVKKNIIDSNDNRFDLQELKTKCLKIFDNFAKYSKEEGQFIISHQSLIKIAKLMNIISPKLLKLSDIDMILKKVCNGTKLNSHQFLDFIVQLSMRIDPQGFESQPKNTTINIIKSFFEPFINQLEQDIYSTNDPQNHSSQLSTQQPIITFLSKYEIDIQTVSIMNNIYYTLKEIYTSYFYYEINSTREGVIQQRSLDNYIEFNKDFEICPYLLNMNQIVCYWNYINNGNYRNYQIFEEKRDLGKLFTLSKFACMIIHFGIMTFAKINQAFNSKFKDIEKVLFFLEKLENSLGLKNLERKTNKPHNSSITFIPPTNIIKDLTSNSTVFPNVIDDGAKGQNDLINVKQLKEMNQKSTKNVEIELGGLMKAAPEVIEKIESKLELLREVFLIYSKFGDKLNFNKMNFAGFLNFLKDLDLIHNSKKDVNSELFSNRTLKSPKTATTNRSNLTSPKRKQSCPLIKGKMIDSEALCIFCSLTGIKNFDTSSKYKNHFDRNRGFTPGIGESGRITNIEKSSSLTSVKSNIPMRMDFNIFIKSFEVISSKLYPEKNLDEAMLYFLENDINRINENQNMVVSGKKEIIEILQSIRKEEIVELIKDINVVVKVHYMNYADSSNLIGFDKFFQFYKDFSIFPDIVNLIQAKNIFYALADIFYLNFYDIQNVFLKNKGNSIDLSEKAKDSENRVKTLLGRTELINFDLFLDSLAISSTFIKFSQKYDEVEKILYLIEKMNQSKGLCKSQFKSGQTFRSNSDFSNYFAMLRQKYPSFYEKKHSNYKSNKDQVKFTDIFEK